MSADADGSPADLMAARFAAQLLTGEPARSPEAVARRLLAVQGQDRRGLRLAIRPRSAGLTAADVDQSLTVSRSLLVTWLNRGTLHLVTAEDFWWLHALTAPRMAADMDRRLAREGVPPDHAERAVGVIIRAVTDGPLTRAELAERIAASGVRTQGQAIVCLLALASMRGLIVRGPVLGAEQGFVLVSDWLGPAPAVPDGDAALAELARRYLTGHGPAGDRDLARWSGLPLAQVRRGLAAISGQLADRPDGLAELAGRDSRSGSAGPAVADLPAFPPPRLLGAFDPLLHGWESREPVLGGHQSVVTSNGVFRPFALIGGKAAGTWRLAAGKVMIEPFGPIATPEDRGLRSDAGDVLRFLGLGQAPLRSGP